MPPPFSDADFLSSRFDYAADLLRHILAPIRADVSLIRLFRCFLIVAFRHYLRRICL